MYRKLSLALVLLGSQGASAAEKAYADPGAKRSSYWDASAAKPLQFYVGLSGGVNRMTGRRNEVVTNDLNPVINTFSDNLHFSNKNAHYSAFGGFTWNIFNSPLFIGPEVYLGQAHTQSEHQAFILDEGTNTNRAMQTRLEQSTFAGGSVQIGVHLPCQTRSYLLLGIETSRFRYSIFYIPRSRSFITGGVEADLPPAFFATTKWQRGSLWGIGFEKTCSNFRFGGDIRIITYKTFRASYVTDSGAPDSFDTIINFFKPRNIRFSLRASYNF